MNTNKKWLIKNKKAGEKWLSIWWIFSLAVIGGVIVIGVLIYYNADINIKELEADILAERIVRCLTEGGYLRQDFLQDSFDIFKECNLKREVFGKGSNFYFNVSIYDAEGKSLREKDIAEGAYSFEKECRIEKTIKAKHYPKCSEKNEVILYYKDDKIKEGKLKVLTASNQNIKKVSPI